MSKTTRPAMFLLSRRGTRLDPPGFRGHHKLVVTRRGGRFQGRHLTALPPVVPRAPGAASWYQRRPEAAPYLRGGPRRFEVVARSRSTLILPLHP